jgi:hypothetical protein
MKMNIYILESDKLDGEQAYFVNIPSKFISKNDKQMWLLYSGKFAKGWNGQSIVENPPDSHYGMVF